MLAKKFRLPVQGFAKKTAVLSKGKLLTIKAAPNNLNYNRFGVIVSRGRIKLATERNLVRRTIFDFLRGAESVKKTSRAQDYLIIINPGRGKIEKQEIIEELKNGRNF